ncbi:MAG: hypothetical protein GQ583_06445 [Methyloprofundus sp.]|nr:hypothetical protein [Methyloprofundus sp.]
MVTNVAVEVGHAKKLAKWKAEYGKDSEFVSKEGFPFNAFDDVWVLNSFGRSGDKLDIGGSCHNKLTDDLQCKVRIALAALSETLAVATINAISKAIRASAFTGFSLPELQATCRLSDDSRQIVLKALIRKLHDLYPQEFATQWEWFSKRKPKAKVGKIYDIEKGALSEFEQQSFDRELNHHMMKQLEKVKSAALSGKALYSNLRQLRGLIAIRLMYALVRRPVNLQQLKWNDILPVGASFEGENKIHDIDFSDENEFQVRMWVAKNKSSFREDVERYALRLNVAITKEVYLYQSYYRELLKRRTNSLGITLSEKELNTLLMRCPVFYHSSLFTVEFTNKKVLFESVSSNGAGFHEASANIASFMTSQFEKLKLKSERVPKLRVGNNRIRHTVGVNANIQGYNVHQISKLLGNTVKAAKVYIDLSDEQRANVDDKFVAGTLLKRMFDSNLATLREDERFVLLDDFGNEAGQAKNTLSCGKCEETKPLGCYGCDNFQAFEDGDHSAILEQAQQKYDARIELGEPEHVLGKLATQIRWIHVTIAVCNERLLERRTLNEESL